MAEHDVLNQQLASDLDGAFERFVLAYQERIFRFALRLLGNREDAEEIAQDTFVRAYRALAGYERERIEQLALRSWLYTIVLNQARNRRRGKRLAHVSIDQPENGTIPSEIVSTGDQHQPAERAEEAETGEILAQAILELPPRYRGAVILRHIEGLSYQEISDALDQPVGTAKANVHRGMRLLRQQVSGLDSIQSGNRALASLERKTL